VYWAAFIKAQKLTDVPGNIGNITEAVDQYYIALAKYTPFW
jgi:hypothetical protein